MNDIFSKTVILDDRTLTDPNISSSATNTTTVITTNELPQGFHTKNLQSNLIIP